MTRSPTRSRSAHPAGKARRADRPARAPLAPFLFTLSALAAATALIVPAGADAQTAAVDLKPTVLHRFTTTDPTAPGALPEFPPIVGADGLIHGTTRIGGPTLNLVLPQGVAYRIDPAAAKPYSFELLGDIAMPGTNLLLGPDKVIYGGTGTSNVNNTSQFGVTPAAFKITAGKPSVWFQPTDGPRGQITMDETGRIYATNATTVTECSATRRLPVWRLNVNGTESKLLDFCDYAVGTGNAQTQPKGGSPVSALWSKTDQALYLLTAVQARGVFDASNATDNAGRSFGTLVKIGKAALDAGAAANGSIGAADVQVLHTFLRQRDGEPTASGGRVAGIVESGDWIYGMTYANPPTNGTANSEISGGTLWRVKKTDPASFTVIRRFRDTAAQAADGTAQGDASTPYGTLVAAADGSVYGTTQRDASTMVTVSGRAYPMGAGTIWRVVPGKQADRSDDKFEIVHRFNLATEGGRPVGLSAGPVKGGVQKLYGANSYGGNGETVDPTSLSLGGSGTVYSIDIPLPTVSFTTALSASATTAKVGDRLSLSWATSNATTCTAGGDNGGIWTGAQQTTASALPLTATLSKLGANTFTLSCASQNDGPAATQTVTVTVEAAPVAPSGDSGGGGPIGLALLAPLAALGLRVRRRG
jgi:hypothetical protein